MKCPKCGTDGAYVGLAVIECVNSNCEHFKDVKVEGLKFERFGFDFSNGTDRTGTTTIPCHASITGRVNTYSPNAQVGQVPKLGDVWRMGNGSIIILLTNYDSGLIDIAKIKFKGKLNVFGWLGWMRLRDYTGRAFTGGHGKHYTPGKYDLVEYIGNIHD